MLLVIAADRYRKVCRPLYGQIELKHARLALVAIVIISFVFSVPPLYLYGHRTFPTQVPGLMGQECSIVDKHAGGRFPMVYQGTLAGCFLISTIALSIIYLKIWMETKRHRKYMKEHTLPGQDNSSSSSENGSIHTAGDTRISMCSRKSALCKKISNFGPLGRARRRSGGNEVAGGQARFNSSPDLPNSLFLTTTPFLSQAEQNLSTNSLSTNVAQTINRNSSLPVVWLKRESADVTEVQHDIHAGAHELLAFTEDSPLMERVSGSVATVCSSHDDIQIVEDNKIFGGALPGREPKTRRRPSLPDDRFETAASGPFEVREQRKCLSENLDNSFSRKAFSVVSKTAHTRQTTDSNTPPKGEADVTFRVEIMNSCNAEDNLSGEVEVLNEDRVSFISERLSNRDSKTFSSVRYGRLNKSQSQYELSPSDSNSSLGSQLSTPSLQNRSLEKKLLSPRPRGKLGRMVVSKNMRRIQSNPLFLQTSENNVYQSRSVQSGNTEPFQGRSRSQSDPPARLYNSRFDQSQLFSALSKSKSKSSQSLAVSRVKKAFRATRTTVIACAITTAFVLSYLPHLSLTILRSVWIAFEHQLEGAPLVLYNIFLRSYFVNTAINIFVYGTMNREFREEASKIWTQFKLACSRRKPHT